MKCFPSILVWIKFQNIASFFSFKFTLPADEERRSFPATHIHRCTMKFSLSKFALVWRNKKRIAVNHRCELWQVEWDNDWWWYQEESEIFPLSYADAIGRWFIQLRLSWNQWWCHQHTGDRREMSMRRISLAIPSVSKYDFQGKKRFPFLVWIW